MEQETDYSSDLELLDFGGALVTPNTSVELDEFKLDQSFLPQQPKHNGVEFVHWASRLELESITTKEIIRNELLTLLQTSSASILETQAGMALQMKEMASEIHSLKSTQIRRQLSREITNRPGRDLRLQWAPILKCPSSTSFSKRSNVNKHGQARRLRPVSMNLRQQSLHD